MERRHLFRKLMAGAAGIGFASACRRPQAVFTPGDESASGGGNGPRVQWQMATSWPENLNIRFDIVQQLCIRVGELTQGNFAITAFPSGGIAPPEQIFDTVQQGGVECGHSVAAYYIDKARAFTFATGMPFGLNPNQHLAWLHGAGGQELLRTLYADFGLINFQAGSSGNQMGGWFRNKVNSLEDMKGLKMRMPGLGAEVVKRMGLEVRNLPANEILLGLERGDIDAAEWNSPYDDEKLGLNKYARYYYYPGWHDPGSTYELIVNRDAYDRLPEDYRKALEVAAFEAQVAMLSQFNSANQEALQRLISSGVELLPYSEEILQEARKITSDLYTEYASQDSTFRAIYNSWNAFRKGIHRWNGINERSFANLVFEG